MSYASVSKGLEYYRVNANVICRGCQSSTKIAGFLTGLEREIELSLGWHPTNPVVPELVFVLQLTHKLDSVNPESFFY